MSDVTVEKRHLVFVVKLGDGMEIHVSGSELADRIARLGRAEVRVAELERELDARLMEIGDLKRELAVARRGPELDITAVAEDPHT